ncbi:MAG: hypothetical protein QXN90_07275 [Zestosphaera sp.]
MKNLLRNLKVPLILMLYGFFLILIQIVLIRSLVSLSTEWSHSILVQALAVILYVCLNTGLLYSWYKLTTYIRNRELIKSD